MDRRDDWRRMLSRRYNRRQFLRGGVLTGLGLTGATLIGCGQSASTSTPTATGLSQQLSPVSANTVVAASPTPAKVVPKGQIVYAQTAEVQELDPHTSLGGAGNMLYLYSVFATLLDRDLDLKQIGRLASSYKVINDGKGYEVVLRKEAKWHDGSPVTSPDFKFSFERIMSPWGVKGYPRPYLTPLMEGIEVVDDQRFLIHMKKLDSGFTGYMEGTFFAVPKAYVEKVGDEGFRKRPIGSGAYKVIKWVRDQGTELEAYKGYLGQTPAVKTVVLKSVPEPATRVAMLQTGEVDIIESIPPPLVKQIQDTAGLKIMRVESNMAIQIHIDSMHENDPDTGQPNPFRDKRVRQALNYAVDKKAIIEKVLLGQGGALGGPWGAKVDGFDPAVSPYEYNPEKAKQLLQEAKFPFDQEWNFYTYAGSAGTVDACQATAGYLNKVGVKTKVQNLEFGAWIKALTEKKTVPLTLIRGGDGFDPIPRVKNHLGSSGLYSIHKIQAADQLADEITRIYDPAERIKQLKKLYAMMQDEAMVIPLYLDVQNYGLGKKVDWKMTNPSGYPRGLEYVTWRE